MASQTEICNMAISHLGIGKDITSLTTDRSQEAAACRRFYDTTRDMALKKYPWNFAKREVSLALIEEDPNYDWAYAYRYPSDCVLARRILNAFGPAGFYSPVAGYDTTANVYAGMAIPFLLGADDAGQIIYSNETSAILEYTKRVTDPSLYSADFTMSFSLLLASFIAPRITSGDDFKKANEMLQKSMMFFESTFTSSANEMASQPLRESEFILVRS